MLPAAPVAVLNLVAMVGVDWDAEVRKARLVRAIRATSRARRTLITRALQVRACVWRCACRGCGAGMGRSCGYRHEDRACLCLEPNQHSMHASCGGRWAAPCTTPPNMSRLHGCMDVCPNVRHAPHAPVCTHPHNAIPCASHHSSSDQNSVTHTHTCARTHARQADEEADEVLVEALLEAAQEDPRPLHVIYQDIAPASTMAPAAAASPGWRSPRHVTWGARGGAPGSGVAGDGRRGAYTPPGAVVVAVEEGAVEEGEGGKAGLGRTLSGRPVASSSRF